MLRRHALLGLLAAGPTAQAAGLRVMGARSEEDHRYDFPQRFLAALLRAAGLDAMLQTVPGLSQREVAAQLAEGGLDLAILPTVGVQQPTLTPLRFPIRRGLLGARLLLARPATAARLRRLTRLQALKRDFVQGYGADWHDLPQLQALGFRTQVIADYPELFRALARGEIDYLSRGANEIWAEIDHPLLVPHGIQIVPDIALSYPLDDYVYVGPARRDWLPRLQAGVEQLWRSGAYQRLFFDSYGRALQRAGFVRRRVLPVLGYGVEPGTPLASFDALRLRPVRAQARLPA